MGGIAGPWPTICECTVYTIKSLAVVLGEVGVKIVIVLLILVSPFFQPQMVCFYYVLTTFTTVGYGE